MVISLGTVLIPVVIEFVCPFAITTGNGGSLRLFGGVGSLPPKIYPPKKDDNEDQ